MVIAISRLSINYMFPKVAGIFKTYLILFLQDPKRKRRGARVATLLLNYVSNLNMTSLLTKALIIYTSFFHSHSPIHSIIFVMRWLIMKACAGEKKTERE